MPGPLSDALNLPRLPDSTMNFSDVANANAVGDEVSQLGNDIGNQEKAAKGPQSAFQEIKYSQNKEGGFDVAVKMPSSTYDYLGNLLQTGMATQQAFAQARAQLAAKREFQEKHPFVAAIGKVASTAAAQYGSGYGLPRGRDISPLIRASGAYGLDQFGETPSELARQEAGLQAQEFGVANTLYNQKQQDDILKQTAAREDRRARTAEESLAVEKGNLKDRQRDSVFNPYTAPASAGKDVSEAFVAEAKASGLFTEKEIQGKTDALKMLAAASREATARKEQRENDLLERKFSFDIREAAARRAAEAGQVKASVALGGIRDIDGQIYTAQRAQNEGFAYLENLSSELLNADGTPMLPPKNKQDGLKVLNAALRDAQVKGADQRAIDAMRKEGAAAIAALDPTDRITNLVRQRDAYAKALPKEFKDLGTRSSFDALDEEFYSKTGNLPTAEDRIGYARAKLKADVAAGKVKPEDAKKIEAEGDSGILRYLINGLHAQARGRRALISGQ